MLRRQELLSWNYQDSKGVHEPYAQNWGKTISADQTGQFSKKLQRDNKYIMVMVKIDSDFILVKPMTSRKDKEM